MRDHYEAFGAVCAAAIANGDRIVHSENETTGNEGTLGVRIHYRGATPASVAARPTAAYLVATVERRYRYMDAFDPDELVHITDATEFLEGHEVRRGFDGSVRPLVYEENATELFDGVAVSTPVYAYDEFGVREYRDRLDTVDERSRRAMDAVSTEFDVSMDAADATDDADDHYSGPQGFY
ncbi:MAG: hypothetical protein ABEI99_02495 [Halobaculum sp.]